MRRTRVLYGAGLMLGLLAGCGGNEPEVRKNEVRDAAGNPVSGAGAYEVVQVADGGSIGGTITISGSIPALPRRDINKDPKVCGAGARDSHQLIVNKSGGLKNAVVIVEAVKRGKAIPAAAQNAEIDQSKCEYVPHVQVVPVNTELGIRNSDPALHNIHFYQNDESLSNIAQPVQGQVNKQKLEKTGFVYAECDVHGWMQAHVAVVDNPYFAVTDENGKFSIADLPPGTYTVKIWHEYLGERTGQVAVGAKAESALNLDLKDLLARKSPAAITSAPSSTAPAAKTGPEVTVQMVSDGADFRYEPENLTIKMGTTVRWANPSENRHTATADPEFEDTPGQAVLPAGVQPWGSPFVPAGESFTRTFTAPGKYQYFCRNHGQFGMIGGITVVP